MVTLDLEIISPPGLLCRAKASDCPGRRGDSTLVEPFGFAHGKLPAVVRKGKCAAFTLIELLVVLVIIGLLLAALAFTVTKLKQRADRMTCGANLHQIGMGVASYSVDNTWDLPTYYCGGTFAFDTFSMRRSDGELVNLGLLTRYIDEPDVFYCPTQNQSTSPSIARDTPQNRWRLRGAGSGEMRSSYTVRSREYQTHTLGPWTLSNYDGRVIYSDFIGVDNWPATGRLSGTLRAPHDSDGYNRLFGDLSVAWVDADALHARRRVDRNLPTAKDLYEYYKLLDVLP